VAALLTDTNWRPNLVGAVALVLDGASLAHRIAADWLERVLALRG
jgi:hypothetical protein